MARDDSARSGDPVADHLAHHPQHTQRRLAHTPLNDTDEVAAEHAYQHRTPLTHDPDDLGSPPRP